MSGIDIRESLSLHCGVGCEPKPANVVSTLILRFLFPLFTKIFQQVLKGSAFLNHRFKLWNCRPQLVFLDNAVGEGFRNALQSFPHFPDQVGNRNQFSFQGDVRFRE